MTTAIRDALSTVSRLGLDTMLFIYSVERNVTFYPVVQEVFSLIDEGEIEAFSSTITLAEVLTVPKRVGAVEIESAYRRILLGSENFSLIDISADVAERAASLRATHSLKTPDALQIAASLRAGCDAFMTNDRALSRVSEIRVLILEDLLDKPVM